MERKKNILIVVFLILPFLLFASEKERIYNAYVQNKMNDWKVVIDKMGRKNPNNVHFVAELVNYEYGYIGYCLGVDQKKEAKHYLELAENRLEWLEENSFNPSIIHAYKSAFYGFRIGLSPIKAPVIGPKSMKQGELAVAADSTNSMAYIQQGNAQFYMPAVFGGSKTEAIKRFKKAEKLMTLNGRPDEDWNYLSLLVLIGQSYEELKNWDLAKEYYNRALKAEPEFKWVKDELLPGLIKKMNDE